MDALQTRSRQNVINLMSNQYGEPTWLINRQFIDRFSDVQNYIRGDLLDAGCGDMRFKRIVEALGARYTGVDRMPIPGAVNADLRELPFETHSFDTILCFQVLCDLEDPDSLLSELNRVLRIGGALLISVNQQWRLHDEPNDHFRYTPYGLRSVLARNAFRVHQLDPMGGFWAYFANRVGFMVEERCRRIARPIKRSIIGLLHVCVGTLLDRWSYMPGDTQTLFAVATKDTQWTQVVKGTPRTLLFSLFAVLSG